MKLNYDEIEAGLNEDNLLLIQALNNEGQTIDRMTCIDIDDYNYFNTLYNNVDIMGWVK